MLVFGNARRFVLKEFSADVATTVYLIRHAPHADVGRRLSGRMAGLGLTHDGAALAERLAARFEDMPIATVQSSPIERAMETARPLAALSGRDVEPVEALTEIDFGEWTGAAFDELDDDPRWRAWNQSRAAGCCPGGESMAAAQRRIVDHLFATARDGAGPIAMVTHCDLVRAAVAHVLGLSMDHIHRFEVSPASITEIAIDDDGARLVQLNQRVQ